jgi:hypothetical protein
MPAGKDGEGGDALDGEEGGERHCGVGVCFCHEQKEGDGGGATQEEEAEPGGELGVFHCGFIWVCFWCKGATFWVGSGYQIAPKCGKVKINIITFALKFFKTMKNQQSTPEVWTYSDLLQAFPMVDNEEIERLRPADASEARIR